MTRAYGLCGRKSARGRSDKRHRHAPVGQAERAALADLLFKVSIGRPDEELLALILGRIVGRGPQAVERVALGDCGSSVVLRRSRI